MEGLHCAGLAVFVLCLVTTMVQSAGESCTLEGGREVQCPQLTLADLGNDTAFSTEGIVSSAVGFPVRINRINIVCLSISNAINTYQSASVLVGFFCQGCPGREMNEEIVEQFTFDCGLSSMSFAWNSSSVVRDSNTSLISFDTPPSPSCALCEHPSRLQPLMNQLSYNPITHCISKLSPWQ